MWGAPFSTAGLDHRRQSVDCIRRANVPRVTLEMSEQVASSSDM